MHSIQRARLEQRLPLRRHPHAFSPSNRAFANPLSELLADPHISITGNVQYFDLKSAHLACYLYAVGALQPPVDCIITVVGTKTSGAMSARHSTSRLVP
jgi:hypothetical protein